jgi:hypothetical protein
VPLDRAAYNGRASPIRVAVLPNQATPIYGIWTPTADNTNVRFEVRARVGLKQIWLRWVKVRPVVSVPKEPKEVLLTNPSNETATFMLPNGQEYADVEENVVTFSIDLPPYGSALLFDKGYNPSLVRAPNSAPMAQTKAPSSTGATPTVAGSPSGGNNNSPVGGNNTPSGGNSSPSGSSVNSSASSRSATLFFSFASAALVFAALLA